MPATQQLERGLRVRRVGVLLLLISMSLGIGSQIADNFRPGIIACVPLLVIGTALLFYSMRYSAAARKMVADQIGLPREQAKYIPVVHGIRGYDNWLAARSEPRWPARGWAK